LALCSANAGAKVLGRRRPRRKWLKIDALSPIADNATADYAAVFDRGNSKGAEVLKELVRKSVVLARHYVNTKIFGECINQVRRMEAAIVFGPIYVQGNVVDEQMSTTSSCATASSAFLASRGCRPR
jgi:hypothetical protein